MERVRSFIAIELPPEIIDQLRCIEESLKERQYPFVKWVNPESIHLTLKFLGEVESDTLPRITEAISGICCDAPCFNLKVGELGTFPGWQRPQVLWVGLGSEIDKLVALQGEIDAALSSLGFPPESRSFSPHLTLSRLRDNASPKDRQNFSEWVRSHRLEDRPSFEVGSVSLMKSQLSRDGAVYSQIARIELQRQP